MAYEKTNWKTGDIVSSEKLNKIEQGIQNNGGFIVVGDVYRGENSYDYGLKLNATWNQIQDAMLSGKNVILTFTQAAYENFAIMNGSIQLVMQIYKEESQDEEYPEDTYIVNTYNRRLSVYGNPDDFPFQNMST